jgi:hypothetical protein
VDLLWVPALRHGDLQRLAAVVQFCGPGGRPGKRERREASDDGFVKLAIAPIDVECETARRAQACDAAGAPGGG